MQNNAVAQGVTGTMLGTMTLFRNLPLADREEIARHFTLRFFKRNTYVVSMSRKSTEVYFLASGAVNVCAFSHDGKLVHYDKLHPGTMFGEISAIDEGERTSNCIAVMDCTMAVATRDVFLRLLREYPPVQDAVLRQLTGLLRQHMTRVYEFSAYKVPQRIRHELIRLASTAESTQSPIPILDPPTHAELAARIATHREAVTHELNKLVKDGVISWRAGGEHLIHDIGALTELAAP